MGKGELTMTTSTKTLQSVKILPWGEEVHLEIAINKKSANKFYARHGRSADGKDYIEFAKFGPKPNTENETYSQKLRIFSPVQWATIKHHVEGELAASAGWDLNAAQKEFESAKAEEPKEK